ncbi:MAG TPA: DUF1631 family protein, partial [Burkholderiaceae bacterium]
FTPCRSEAEQQRLRARLPGLVQGLQQGFALIGVPEAQRSRLLDELQQAHARVLRGQPAAAPIPAAPPAATAGEVPTTRRDNPPTEPSTSALQQLLDERESQMPSHWSRSMIDRGHLRTVPTQLYTQHDSPDARAALVAWTDKLQVGAWYHLFIQSQWLTAQIAWIGESRQYFLFVGQDSDDRQTLTMGAIERLLANGLITALSDDSLVQRAVDTLMQDLSS